MRRKPSLIMIIMCFVLLMGMFGLSLETFAGELKREDGLSVHVLPKRVAELDENKEVKWGFMISQSHSLKQPLERPIFQKPEELIAYFKNQPKNIQENGIWMIVTHPDAYSDEEKVSIEKLKELCKKEDIALFICRGSELPEGWKRVK